MTDQDFMHQAIEVAKKSAEKYKHPVGAVLVREGNVVTSGLSRDHNFHAELNCIHEAHRILDVAELTGCTLYATQESCLMCFGASLYANIDRLVFGAYASDLTETNTYEYKDFSLEPLAKEAVRFDGQHMSAVGGALREGCKVPMADAVYWSVK